jgi:hypothetical protein
MAINENVWDIFISHASEDKAQVARPLANKLAEVGLKVWLDEAELSLGDSLRNKIDEGLSRSQFGVVILSHSFFAKKWSKLELAGLFAKDIQNGKTILPVWHDIEYEEILTYSPLLADRLSISTKNGLTYVRDQIANAIRRAGKNKRIEQPIYAGRLSKKKLMSFPNGSFFMLNLIHPINHSPLYAEELGGEEQREALWQKLKNQNITSSKCYIFSSAAGYRAHLYGRRIWRLAEEDPGLM